MKEKIKAFLTRDVTAFFVRRFSSFTYLNVTQFLGALNDNIFKLLTVFFCISIEGIGNSHKILALSGAIFVLPFLLFSSSSGSLADRFSKRNIIVGTKIFELVIMLLGLASFASNNTYGAYSVLFLLATQSAIFGPSKYGILPELVTTERISKANGVMTMFTFLAIIVGTFFASFLLDISGRNFILAASFCTLISIAGLATSFCIEYTPPSEEKNPIKLRFLTDTWRALQIAREQPSLLMAIVGASFFLFVGAFAQLNMIPYAVQSLHLTDIQGGYLFLLTAIGIGIGSMVAGKISGSTVELGIVPIACLGLCMSLYMFDFLSDHLNAVLPLAVIVGFFGGCYEVPLDSYIQVASPPHHRGKIIGATNFLSYFGVLLASLFLILIGEVFGLEADKGFTVMGCIMLTLTIFLTFQYFDYLTRLGGTILSRLHFNTTYSGMDNIPEQPSVYLCTHTAWNDTLLMLGSQRRRMRFFVEQEQEHTKWMKKLYKMLKVALIPEPLDHNTKTLSEIREALDSGISVCVFVQNHDICKEMDKLVHSYTYRWILKDTPYPIIPVAIEKGTLEKERRFFTRLLNKFRIPAAISFGNLVCDIPVLPKQAEDGDEPIAEPTPAV